MYPVSGRYLQAVRNGGQQSIVADTYRGGTLVAGGADLALETGTITDDSTPGVRRQLSVELSRTPGLFDLLAPSGTRLVVRSILRFADGTTETVPMGVFDIDAERIGYGPGGSLKVEASDRWGEIQRGRFIVPQPSAPGVTVVEMINRLIFQAIGENAVRNSPSTATVGSLVWDTDRSKAVNDLAESIGAYVYFDRNGVCVIDDLTSDGPAVWSADVGASGVLLDANRSRDRLKTYNVVVVNPETASGAALFDPVVIFDGDPASPTYAGTDPQFHPELAGPFGVSPYPYSSPLVQNSDQARAAGRTILARVTGFNAQLSLSQVRNHALDATDVINVMLPQERYDIPRAIETHVIDKITHPLTPDGVQTIETRATRADTP